MRYLLVTHIPFTRTVRGGAVVDSLWARDLRATAAALGPFSVAAPELTESADARGWGPGSQELLPSEGIRFAGFPNLAGTRNPLKRLAVRSVLSREVEAAEVVQTSNLFPPYLGLGAAHTMAVAKGKKTVFVVAEDFHDMFEWEWVRTADNPVRRWRRQQLLSRMHRWAEEAARTASLTFLHTPAAVERYRLVAANSMAIRQPTHEADDVISEAEIQSRCASALTGRPLRLIAACRHSTLKGLDFLLRAVRLLEAWDAPVEVRLYGEGAGTANLRALAERLGIAHRVEFRGAIALGPVLRQALADGDLFVMAHRTTDFGRAFFDAMAAGLPVIAFQTPASQGTVRHLVDGLLTPMDDAESLADAVNRFDRDRNFLVQAAFEARKRALRNTATTWHSLRAGRIRELCAERGATGDRKSEPVART